MNKYKTIIISDIHLGSPNSRAKEVTDFLKNNSCDTLILNGDIIDMWALKRGAKWKKKHTQFFRQVLKMTYENNTKVIYIRGNHDDFLDEFVPFHLGMMDILKDYVHESHGKRYYVVHGDIFDVVTTKLKWLSKFGGWMYDVLLWVNRKYNQRREKKGLPYYSLSKDIKNRVKIAVNFVSSFEETLSELAKNGNYDGVICGHIHHPEIKTINGIEYLNSGDWVESLTAIVETHKGEFMIKGYIMEKG